MRLLRRLLFLLLASNLLLLLWNSVRPAGPELLRGGFNDSLAPLVHLREQPDFLLQGVSAVSDVSAVAGSNCRVRGPFSSNEDALVAMAGVDIAYRVVVLRTPVQESRLYRAMIAPADSLADAQLRLAAVRAAIERIGGGIDTYLVTSGSIANAVSLGLFSEQSNAVNVQSRLASEGVDVVIDVEFRTAESYWVVVDAQEVIDINDESSSDGVFQVAPPELSENLCEMIAQAG